MMLLGQYLQPGNPLMTAAGWLIVAVCAFLNDGIRGTGAMTGTVLLKIATRMGAAEIEAFIDTGNRLHEPLSGLPIIIVAERWLRGVLDESCFSRSGGRLPPGFRIVRYGALGASGEMICFRPESVCVCEGREWVRGPDVWVAIYPDEMPGTVEALAPPSFGQVNMR